MNSSGDYVGELCHIEAAKPGGARFNQDMTNEERRSFDNLMLMCHDHHVVTSDEDEFTVEDLREMKYEHENKFSDIESKIQSEIKDITLENKPHLPENMRKIYESLGWVIGSEELEITCKSTRKWVKDLSRVPEKARRLLSVIVERAGLHDCDSASLEEVRQAAQISTNEVEENIRILESHDMVSEPHTDINEQWVVSLRSHDSTGWPIFEDIYQFCETEDIPVSSLIVDLHFDLLDKDTA
jgi:hypothetical protein